jgi:hypothetical protein
MLKNIWTLLIFVNHSIMVKPCSFIGVIWQNESTMDHYEKSLRKKLKRDTFIGLGVIGFILVSFIVVVVIL